jgi:hypothetical protein
MNVQGRLCSYGVGPSQDDVLTTGFELSAVLNCRSGSGYMRGFAPAQQGLEKTTMRLSWPGIQPVVNSIFR